MDVFNEPTISEMRDTLKAAGFKLQEYKLEGYVCYSWENISASFPVTSEAQSVKLAYAYLKEQEQYKAMRDYLLEVYELIASRVGAELKVNPNTNISFAACLPTKHVNRLEEIVNELKQGLISARDK